MQESIAFLVCVQCRRKESSRSLYHLLMSLLCRLGFVIVRRFVCVYAFVFLFILHICRVIVTQWGGPGWIEA